MTIFTASVYHRPEKPYGVGKTADQRHKRIVGGWRAEIIDGLEDGHAVYTGVCETREGAIAELITHLKSQGRSGALRIA